MAAAENSPAGRSAAQGLELEVSSRIQTGFRAFGFRFGIWEVKSGSRLL